MTQYYEKDIILHRLYRMVIAEDFSELDSLMDEVRGMSEKGFLFVEGENDSQHFIDCCIRKSPDCVISKLRELKNIFDGGL